jgi:hypothetical protein
MNAMAQGMGYGGGWDDLVANKGIENVQTFFKTKVANNALRGNLEFTLEGGKAKDVLTYLSKNVNHQGGLATAGLEAIKNPKVAAGMASTLWTAGDLLDKASSVGNALVGGIIDTSATRANRVIRKFVDVELKTQARLAPFCRLESCKTMVEEVKVFGKLRHQTTVENMSRATAVAAKVGGVAATFTGTGLLAKGAIRVGQAAAEIGEVVAYASGLKQNLERADELVHMKRFVLSNPNIPETDKQNFLDRFEYVLKAADKNQGLRVWWYDNLDEQSAGLGYPSTEKSPVTHSSSKGWSRNHTSAQHNVVIGLERRRRELKPRRCKLALRF